VRVSARCPGVNPPEGCYHPTVVAGQRLSRRAQAAEHSDDDIHQHTQDDEWTNRQHQPVQFAHAELDTQ
jgi:hypothetical protein